MTFIYEQLEAVASAIRHAAGYSSPWTKASEADKAWFRKLALAALEAATAHGADNG